MVPAVPSSTLGTPGSPSSPLRFSRLEELVEQLPELPTFDSTQELFLKELPPLSASKIFKELIEELLGSIRIIGRMPDKQRIFRLLFRVIPLMNDPQMRLFLPSQGSNSEKSKEVKQSPIQELLNHTSDLPEYHQKLALLVGYWFLKQAENSGVDFDVRLNLYQEVANYVAQAWLISQRFQLDSKDCNFLFSELFFQITKTCLAQQLRSSRSFPSYVREIFDQISQKAALCFSEHLSRFVFNLYSEARSVITGFKHTIFDDYIAEADQKRETFVRCEPVEVISYQYQRMLSCYRQHLQTFASQSADVSLVRSFQASIFEELKSLVQLLLRHAFLIVGPAPCFYDVRIIGSAGRQEQGPYSDVEIMILYKPQELASLIEWSEEGLKSWHESYFKMLTGVLNFLMVSIGETAMPGITFKCLHDKNPSGFHLDCDVNPFKDPHLMGTPAQVAELQREGAAPRTSGHVVRKSLSIQSNYPSLEEEYAKALKEILDPEDRYLRKQLAFKLFKYRLNNYEEVWEKKPLNFHFFDVKEQFINLFHLISDLSFYFGIDQTNTLDIISALATRGVFHPRTGQLFQEVFALLYQIRCRLHLSRREQSDEAFARSQISTPNSRGILREQDRTELERCYCLVLCPLYQVLSKAIQEEQKFEERFKDLDFFHIVSTEILESDNKEEKLKTTLCFLVSYFSSFPEYHEPLKKFYSRLSEKTENQYLREIFIQALEHQLARKYESLEKSLALQALIEEIAAIPDPTGLRMSMRRDQQDLVATLIDITSSEPQSQGKITQVRIKSPSLPETFLNREIIKEILDETGHIRNSYAAKESAHSVTSSKVGLHFKEMPVQPLMEYAIYNLFFRLYGRLSPATELAEFEVTMDGKKEVFPVLISKTIPGTTVNDKLPAALDHKAWERWTWMILCIFLTKSGDGLPSNYIFNGQQIYCIDNDISFVFPFTEIKNMWGFPEKKEIHFCSALFFLFPGPLSSEALEKFRRIQNIDEILNAWIEDVIKKEEKYLGLFSERDGKRWLENPVEKKRFSATVFFHVGALTTLKLQFHRLQNYLLEPKHLNKPPTALELLEQMVIYCDFKDEIEIGPYVSLAYRQMNARDLPLQEKTIQIRGQQRGGSLSLTAMHKVCLGLENAPSFEQVEKLRRWTPAKAREEFFFTLLTRCSPYIRFRKNEDQVILHANFRGELPESPGAPPKPFSASWQSLILKALRTLVQNEPKKPTAVRLQHCTALDSMTLEPFLHENLEELDLSFCPKISDEDILRIQEKCPFLNTLRLTGCSRLENIGNPGTIWMSPLNFSRDELKTLNGHTDEIAALVSFENGQKLASASYDKTIRIWDVQTGELLKTLRGHTDAVKVLLPLDNGKKLASASHDKTIRIWDIEAGQTQILTGHEDKVTTLILGDNGKKLVSGSYDKTIRVWDIATRQLLQTLAGHTDRVTCLLMLKGGELVSGSRDTTIRKWNITTEKELRIFRGHTNCVTSLVELEDGEKFASEGMDGTIRIWDNKTEKVQTITTGTHETKAFNALISLEKGKKLASLTFDRSLGGFICFWQAKSGTDIYLDVAKTMISHTQKINALISFEGGKKLASGSKDKTICIRDGETEKCLKKFTGHTGSIGPLVTLDSDRKLASGSKDKTIRIWSLKPGLEHLYLDGCENLQGLYLRAPSLKTLVFDNTSRLINEQLVVPNEVRKKVSERVKENQQRLAKILEKQCEEARREARKAGFAGGRP